MERSPLFLMANLGAEVSKIFSGKDKGDNVVLSIATKKAREIISDIMKYPEMRARTVEIEALSSIISNISKFYPQSQTFRKNLTSYFYPFVIRLMDK